MAVPVQPKFCTSCGGALMPGLARGRHASPFQCSACGMRIYNDPKVAVAMVVRNRDGKILLLRRAQRDQAHGKWILPGGHVDLGEVAPQAALRELAEETGLKPSGVELLGVYSYQGYPVILIVYTADTNGCGFAPDLEEALDSDWFGQDDIPWDELGYASTRDALIDFFKRHLG